MAAPTEYYCDPTLTSDTGDGTLSTPWGRASENVVQYALDTLSADATNGVRLNVKSGTPNPSGTLSATLTLASCAHAAAANAPLIIQGYDSVTGDRGMGEIDGGGSYGCFDSTWDYIQVADMEIYNAGSSILLALDNYCQVERCIFHGTTSYGLHFDVYGCAHECYLYDIGGYGIDAASAASIRECYFANGPTNSFSHACWVTHDTTVTNCIFSLSGVSNAIRFDGHHPDIFNNSILSAGGSGAGILMTASGTGGTIANNIIEGFSSGYGINFANAVTRRLRYSNNAFYNNATTELNKNAGAWLFDEKNTVLTASAFAKSGSDTYANRLVYFNPLDTDGDIFEGGWPAGYRVDKGAIQHEASGGGSGIFMPRPHQIGL